MRIMKLAPIALALVLGACSDEPEPQAIEGPGEQGGEAAGEVLGGSISDAMLPLDELQSQSPPLRDASSSGESGGEQEATTETDEASAPTPSAAPSTLPSPRPAPSAIPTAAPLQVAPPVDDGPDS